MPGPLLRPWHVADDRRIAELSEALRRLGNEDSAERALLTGDLAIELTWSVPFEVREQMAWRAVAIARRLGDDATLAQTLHRLAEGLLGSPDVTKQSDVANELLAVSERADLPQLARWARLWNVAVLLQHGRHGEAESEIARVAWTLETQPDDVLRYLLTAASAGLLIARGTRDEGLRVAHEASSSVDPTYRSVADTIFEVQSIVAAWDEGCLDGSMSDAVARPEVLAFVCAEAGRMDDAERALSSLDREGFQGLASDHRLPSVLVGLAIAAHRLGSVPAATTLYRMLTPFEGTVAFAGTFASFGPISYALGLVAEVLGRENDAVRHLRDAVALNERADARPHLARAQYALGRMILERRWAGGLEEAATLLGSAREIAVELGMSALLAEIDVLSSDGRPGTTAGAGGGRAGWWRERYEPLAVLRRGGQGQVVRAVDHQHDRVVALKVRPVRDEADRSALLTEARVLLDLQPHAALPLVRDDFFHDDRYVIVMDWIDGTDLAQVLIDRGDPGLPFETVLGYLSAAADALDHLHSHRPPVVHGDVKPGNLVLTPGGSVVLVDFGISGLGSRAGSPGFRAPEVAAGERATPAVDVYGLAATAYALLTGHAPDGTPRALEHVDTSVAAAVEHAIRRGLAIDPARRPGSATEFLSRLRAVRTA